MLKVQRYGDKMNLLFFLGSGVSLKSGLPDTKAITESLINGKWWHHTDQNFYPGEQSNPVFAKFEITPKIQGFLKYLKEYSDMNYQGFEEANYEDLYFLVKQIHDELTHETYNPALKFFIDHLQEKYNFGKNPEIADFDIPIDFNQFIWKAEDFINCVVWQSLPVKSLPVGFDLLKEVIESGKFDKVDIATTNHDLLIETFLEQNSIGLVDGFSAPDGDFCYLIPDLYKSEDAKVRLFKLHGSVNWYRVRREYDEVKKQTIDHYAKVLRNHWRMNDSKGNFIGSTLEHYPMFLTGTINKLSEYNFGIVRYIHIAFDSELMHHKTIIMSGYGWNDKGINGRLQEWIMSSDEHKIILLHEDPESLKKSKSAMWNSYDNLVKWGRLIPVKKWMSDTKLIDIINLIK